MKTRWSIIWLVAGSLVLGFIVGLATGPDWTEPGTLFGDLWRIAKPTDPTSFWTFALVVVALAALRSLGLTKREIKSNHDWNRRRTAHDLIFESTLGRFRSLNDQIAKRADIHNEHQTYATLDPKPDKEFERAVEAILNYLEDVCLAVKNNIVDEDIAFECLGSIMTATWRWAEPHVKECRKIDRAFWIQIDPIVADWNKRQADLVSKLEDANDAAAKAVAGKGKDKL